MAPLCAPHRQRQGTRCARSSFTYAPPPSTRPATTLVREEIQHRHPRTNLVRQSKNLPGSSKPEHYPPAHTAIIGNTMLPAGGTQIKQTPYAAICSLSQLLLLLLLFPPSSPLSEPPTPPSTASFSPSPAPGSRAGERILRLRGTLLPS